MNPAFVKLFWIFVIIKTSSASAFVCNSDLLFSYGIQNPQYLNQTSLFCQNGIEETCCSNNDISSALEDWNNKYRFIIQPYYELTSLLYRSIFQYYEDLILNAKYIYVDPDSDDSCRQSAEFLILNYIDHDDIKKFTTDLDELHNFLSEIRRGFFCSICSVQNQKYFDTDLKKVVFSYNSCQDLAAYTIETIAIRINRIMPVLANINSLLNCQLKTPNEDNELFSITLGKFEDINKCFKAYEVHKGKSVFFDKCEDFCSEFSLVSPTENFEGNLRPLLRLKEKIQQNGLVPTDPIFPDVDVRLKYHTSTLMGLFFDGVLSFQDLFKYKIVFERYGLNVLQDSAHSLFYFSRESSIEHLIKSAQKLKLGVLFLVALIVK